MVCKEVVSGGCVDECCLKVCCGCIWPRTVTIVA